MLTEGEGTEKRMRKCFVMSEEGKILREEGKEALKEKIVLKEDEDTRKDKGESRGGKGY